MWPFRRRPDNAALAKELADLKLRLTALEDAHEQLVGQHTKLRGTVYGRLTKAGQAADAPPAETREQLKARLLSGRFVPGRPVHHD